MYKMSHVLFSCHHIFYIKSCPLKDRTRSSPLKPKQAVLLHIFHPQHAFNVPRHRTTPHRSSFLTTILRPWWRRQRRTRPLNFRRLTHYRSSPGKHHQTLPYRHRWSRKCSPYLGTSFIYFPRHQTAEQ